MCVIFDGYFKKINKFEIQINGRNTYLSFRINNLCASILFMNTYNKVYEYNIYIPECNNISYEFENSLNENRTEENKELLNKLFEVKSNNYYINIWNNPDNNLEFK